MTNLNPLLAITAVLVLAPAAARANPTPRIDREATISSGLDYVEGAAPIVIYMNRHGGTFVPGTNDAQRNRSTIAKRTTVIEPWDVSEQDWQEVMATARELWKPFNVIVTDVEPSEGVTHFESVVAGHPEDLDKNGILGVSPYAYDCTIVEASIGYTFAEFASDAGMSPRRIAEVAAQEMAHSFGLDHTLLAEDPMSYLSYAAPRSFQDRPADCGETPDEDKSGYPRPGPRTCGLSAANPCANLGVEGSTTQQNSYQALMDRLGPREVGIWITSPKRGSDVDPTFEITTAVMADNPIVEVSFFLNGELFETKYNAPFDTQISTPLENGDYTVTARIVDTDGNVLEDSVHIQVDPNNGLLGCSGSNSPATGLSVLFCIAVILAARRHTSRAQSCAA